ncbi:endo-1,4-beta-xylanase [Paenibacillus cellulosilyticus]|uniref:Beta-xylanase n=1 Tax=Paenibacillus cellulosilyticus TaxID=375489 RepID=A0A2V2YSI1_9BACL|nr:endo-1,4-beta-xylanase [Paenibacillus cellulosilyticus]PWW01129.1 endo-1,4-beta-xylanase [Paenibacillus cellulosilyticus]QKS46903.1 endo-1,4-beta-xylanase [Paenibacillus cellulosilyticus]
MSRVFKKMISGVLAAALLIPSGWLATGVEQAAAAVDTITVYHEDFAADKGKATQAGSASLSQVTNKVFAGNDDGAALYVSNRVNNWDSADFKFADIGLENGKTYTVTATIYVDEGETIPEGATAALQTVDSYGNYAEAAMEAGQAVTLTKQFTVDTSADKALRINSNAAGKAVPYYIGDIVITTPNTSTSTTEQEVYHESFAADQGKATQAGSASLSQVTGKVFAGNDDGAALYVSNRVNNWDSADFKFADIGLENGKTYTVTASVYVDTDVTVPEGAAAALQTVDSYGNYAEAAMAAGQAVTLTKEFTVDTSADKALRINSNAAGKAVPYYIGDVRITEKVATDNETETPREAAKPFDTITFEDQTAGGFIGRAGTETLTVTDEDNHTANGAYALKVEGRTNTWHGPSLRVETFVDKGYEYKITAWVKLISPESSQLQLSTQVGSGSSANYVTLSAKTINAADGWVQYEGTYRYNNVGDEYLTIYIESSSNATASYYIDDISFASTGSGPVSIQTDIPSIKDVYENDFLIGNAITAEDLEGVRFDLLKKHNNVATAGNAMKPDALQPTKGNFTFDAADAMVDKVLAAGMKMHGHVLVWHQQSPAWLNTTEDEQGATVPLSRTEALANMQAHISGVMEHFGNKVISWDVVNEAMNDNPGNPADYKASLRQSPWYQAIGDDYVEQAFLAARAVLDAHPDWDIKLYYNDYNDDNQNKATAIYNMVKDINDRYAAAHNGKLLIDGIGMQAHYNINTNPDNVKLSLEKFISLGVEISITELDITAGSNYTLTDKQAVAQAYLYAQLMKLYHEHADSIARVTIWGMDDNTSWRASSNPLLFDKNLQAKPAYYGVIDPAQYLADHQPEATQANQANAAYGTPKIDGTIDSVWSKASELNVNRYQLAWQGASGVAKVLWDDKNLYVLVQVSNAELDHSSPNAWEQDSVEVFLDQNNAKTSSYQDDDGQYRVSYMNETTFNPSSIAAGFESATAISGTNYAIEMKIPLTAITPANGSEVGFDVQINDGKAGARQSVSAWNDTTGTGYMDTSVYGVLKFEGKGNSSTSSGTLTPAAPTTSATTDDNGDNAEEHSNTTDNSTSGGSQQAPAFTDIGSVPWATEAINRLAALGIINGVAASTFDPKALVKRSQLVLMLVRALELEPVTTGAAVFNDVPADRTDAGAIAAAVQAGLIQGSGDSFRPNDAMTREEAVVVLMRAYRYAADVLGLDIAEVKTDIIAKFKDGGQLSKWSADDISAAVGLGLVTGDPTGNFRPQGSITRAETAVLVDRMLVLLASQLDDQA